jgi:hypothetical protein
MLATAVACDATVIMPHCNAFFVSKHLDVKTLTLMTVLLHIFCGEIWESR